MLATTLTVKGQTTIPTEVRKALHLKPGDKVAFEVIDDKAIISKLDPFDQRYHATLSSTVADEWGSTEDEDAYRDL